MVCGGLERPLSPFLKKSLGEVPILSQKTQQLYSHAKFTSFSMNGCLPSLDRFDKKVRQVENVYLAPS